MLIQYTASGLKFKLLATDNNNNNNNWSSQFGGVPEVLPTKQPVWDRPGNLVDKALVEASLNSPHSRSSFLAASSQHSGDWLFALLIASCGLKLDDEEVELRLAWGSGWICASRMSVTAALRLTPVALCWDVTMTCPLADSYVAEAAREAGSAAVLVADARRTYIPALTADTYLNPLQLYACTARRLASSSLTLTERFPSVQGKSERRAFSFRDVQCWCSILALFYCTTVCRPLTARIDGHT